jgi:hypothetical protein
LTSNLPSKSESRSTSARVGVEVGLLEDRVALAVVGDDPVLAAVVVEVDLLAGQELDLGAALVLGLVQPPDVRAVVVVEVIGDDVLAVGVAQRGIDLRDARVEVLGLGVAFLAPAGGERCSSHEQRQASEFRELRHHRSSVNGTSANGNVSA